MPKLGKFISSFEVKPVALSLVIGPSVGLMIILFFSLYTIFNKLSTLAFSLSNYTILFLPALGLVLSYLIVKKLAGGNAGCGTHKLLEAYHYEGGTLYLKDVSVKAIASALTIGFGGSAGLEGPSLLLGGGVASALGKRLNLSQKDIKVCLLSGSAAGLSAIFKAPLTGILFALEIPYQRDLAKEALIPATISSILAYLTTVQVLGYETLFPLTPRISFPTPIMLAHSLVIGILAAALGILFTFFFRRLNLLSKYNLLYLSILGGVILGFTGLFMPQVLGVGYETIRSIISDNTCSITIYFLIALIFLKIFATSITLNCGGSGGLFIPSIFVGALLGSLYSKIVFNNLNIEIVMAAMAASIAASNKTPLAGVAFVAETSGPSSIIPTLIAAVLSYFTSGKFSFYQEVQPMKEPVEEEKALGLLYHLIKEERILDRLEMIKIKEIMTSEPVSLTENLSIRDAMEICKKHEYRVYPVVTKDGLLLGHVTIEDLIAFPEAKWGLKVEHVLIKSPVILTEDDSLKSLVSKMVEEGIDHMYIVSDKETAKLVGVVAGIDLLRKLMTLL